MLDRFVTVRLTHAERFDLRLLQFDPDLSFAVFFMNADKTLYGRYGTRSDFYEAQRDISIDGLGKAMNKALDWHRDYGKMKTLLQGKRNPDVEFENFASYPKVEGRRGYRRGSDNSGRCTHCHDLRTAEQKLYLTGDLSMPDRVLYAWPMPDVLGLKFDPSEITRVREVLPDSTAAAAGIRPGDDLVELSSQPLLSIADVQWVLQNVGETGELDGVVRRGDETMPVKLRLEKNWRNQTDIAWRTTTRFLRDRLFGGILFRELSSQERERHGIKADEIALQAARGVSRNSDKPIRRGDIVIAVAGNAHRLTESQLLGYFAQQSKPGDAVELTVLRDGQRIAVQQTR